MPATRVLAPSASRISAHPLVGATVVVTRPAGAGGGLARRVRALGGAALLLPGSALRAPIDPHAARAALTAARTADLVVFASPAAVRYAFALLPSLRFARGTRVCAVGATTARALRQRKVRASWPHERQDSEGLLALPEFARVRGRRVALIGAPGGRELLPQRLRASGARLAQVFVYRRVPARLDRRHFAPLARAPSPLLTLLSSAEALVNLRAQLPASAYARLLHDDAVVSSARLAAVARASGFARVHLAASAEAAALLAAAVSALAHHRL